MTTKYRKIPILWEDEDILAVSKPAGILTLPDRYLPQIPHIAALLTPRFGPLWINHRLDKETSGVLVLSRSEKAHKILSAQFENRAIQKVYHVLVVGSPEWNEKSVNLPLLADGDRRHRTVIDRRGGKPSITELRVLERIGPFSLIEARPLTGRTHQIRVHLKAVGLPIAVDTLYAKGKPIFLSEYKRGYRASRDGEKPLLARLGLHAFSLTFQHPISRDTITLEAPYAKDFAATIKQLRRCF